MTASDVRASVLRQAQSCERLGSPFTAALLRMTAERLDRASAVGRRILDWSGDPDDDALALRVAGALHGLVLAGRAPALAALYPPARTSFEPQAAEALWSAIERAFSDQAVTLDRWLDTPPQTNEAARAAMLLPGLGVVAAELGRRLSLFEIGASAGLNLRLDRFRYEFGDWRWGDPSAPIALAPEIRGAPPPKAPPFEVAARAGCDVAPVDPADPSAALRLRAYCWPDQAERRARLDAALALAASDGVKVARADAADWVAERIPARPSGAVGVLTHSIMWRYLPAATQRRIEATMAEEGRRATADRPLAWLRMEPLADPSRAQLRLSLWSGEASRTDDLAFVCFHGRWIEWFAAPRPVVDR